MQSTEQFSGDQLSIPPTHTHTDVYRHTHIHAYAAISQWWQVRAEVLWGLSRLCPTD